MPLACVIDALSSAQAKLAQLGISTFARDMTNEVKKRIEKQKVMRLPPVSNQAEPPCTRQLWSVRVKATCGE